MSILVTGAYGQLGRELCQQIGPEALPTDFDTLDLGNRSAVLAALARWRPQAVINCAAYTQVDLAEKEPDRCRAVNATAVKWLAQACAELDCPLVQISTDYVFAGNARPERPFRETDRATPLGMYAITKHEGELAAAAWPKHLTVRTCGLYARPSHAEAKNFVKTMLRLGASGKTLRVVHDQHCTPTYVPHLARAIRFLAGLDGHRPAPWGLYHVVNRGTTTWLEFAREIFRQAGVAVVVEPITTAEYAAPAPRPAYSVLDTSAYHALGGPAMPDWQTGLTDYLAELKHGGPRP